MKRKKTNYEFVKDYDYRVNVREHRAHPEDENSEDVLEGTIKISGDASWNEEEQEYVIDNIYWKDSAGNFDNIIGDPPNDAEDKFIDDFKEYLKDK